MSPAWLPACHTQVNEYPGQRTFKAIGTGDQAFVVAMTACVEEVVGTVHEECISSRLSTKGNYISVTGEGGALSVARAHVWHSAHSTACPARIPAVLSGHVGGMSAACCVGRKGAWAGRQAALRGAPGHGRCSAHALDRFPVLPVPQLGLCGWRLRIRCCKSTRR